MSAGIYNITIEQGADWRLLFVWKDQAGNPHNLTGWTARMQVRETVDSKTALFDLTTENGQIAIGNENGTVEIKIPAAMSQEVKANPKNLVWQDGKQGVSFSYDLELIDTQGIVTRLLQGAAFFVPEVTR